MKDKRKMEGQNKVLIFGGTSEGRELTERLLENGFSCTVCVATEYGAQCLEHHPRLQVRIGRMDCAAMISLLTGEAFSCAVDATHPHAALVTEEIKSACCRTGLPYIRYSRNTGYRDLTGPAPAGLRQIVYLSDMTEAAAFLAREEGKILVTTGSGEIERLAFTLGDPSRIIARILPAEASLQACIRAGLKGRQIIAMQGPFDTEMNCALIRHYGVTWLLTKESGQAGGFPEKLEAAGKCGIGVVVVRSPEQAASGAEGQKIQKVQEVQKLQKLQKLQTGGTALQFTFRSFEEIVEKVRQLTERAAECRDCKLEETEERQTESADGRNRSGKKGDREQFGKEDKGAQTGRENKEIQPATENDEAQYRTEGDEARYRTEGDEARYRTEGDETQYRTEGDETQYRTEGDEARYRTEGDETQFGAEDRKIQCGRKNTDTLELALVGIGVGAQTARTREAQELLERAQVIFGAPGVLRLLQEDPAFSSPEKSTEGDSEKDPESGRRFDPGNGPEKNTKNNHGKSLMQDSENGSGSLQKIWVPEYDSMRILEYLEQHPEISRAAAAYSGDIGFYSAATSMTELVKGVREDRSSDSGSGSQSGGASSTEQRERRACSGSSGLRLPELRPVCGISSISCFSARTGIPWQDMKILSSHGRKCNVIGQVRRHSKCFLLLSGAEDLRRTGALLEDAQKKGILGELLLIYGYALSRPEEEIRECSAAQLRDVKKEGLYVLYIGHRRALDTPIVPGLSDGDFVRGRVPMTSAEVRALSLCRLRLTAGAVVYDIGAGTGSISIEAALMCPEGTVYSVERSEKAIGLLKKNRDRFCLENMQVIEGEAPEALQDLPAPTHAFIGGNGGNLSGILRLLLQKNPSVRIVANCITVETLSEIRRSLEILPVCDVEWTQISAARGDSLGRCHFLRALNPVFVISFTGRAAGKKPFADLNQESAAE